MCAAKLAAGKASAEDPTPDELLNMRKRELTEKGKACAGRVAKARAAMRARFA